MPRNGFFFLFMAPPPRPAKRDGNRSGRRRAADARAARGKKVRAPRQPRPETERAVRKKPRPPRVPGAEVPETHLPVAARERRCGGRLSGSASSGAAGRPPGRDDDALDRPCGTWKPSGIPRPARSPCFPGAGLGPPRRSPACSPSRPPGRPNTPECCAGSCGAGGVVVVAPLPAVLRCKGCCPRSQPSDADRALYRPRRPRGPGHSREGGSPALGSGWRKTREGSAELGDQSACGRVSPGAPPPRVLLSVGTGRPSLLKL